MSKWNIGEIPMRTEDEDLDRDVEIAEAEERRAVKRKSARQRIEDLKEERNVDE